MDRIVGFELITGIVEKNRDEGGLSAGSVQSVAVKLIAEKEREINQFKPTSSFKIEALLAATDVNQENAFLLKQKMVEQ